MAVCSFLLIGGGEYTGQTASDTGGYSTFSGYTAFGGGSEKCDSAAQGGAVGSEGGGNKTTDGLNHLAGTYSATAPGKKYNFFYLM